MDGRNSMLVGGENCNCVMDSNGHAVFAGINNTTIYLSSNFGQTWDSSGTPFVCPSNGEDYTYLAIDLSNTSSYGNCYMVWSSSWYKNCSPSANIVGSFDSNGVFFSRSVDHGHTWSTPIVISILAPDFSSDSAVTPYHMQTCVDANGVVYVLYTTTYNNSSQCAVHVYASTDQGVTFTENGNTNNGNGNTNEIITDWPFHAPISIAASPVDGTVMVACEAGSSLNIIYTTNAGATWTNVYDAFSNNPEIPRCMIDSADNFYVCYYGSADGITWNNLFMDYSTNMGSTWQEIVVNDTPFVLFNSNGFYENSLSDPGTGIDRSFTTLAVTSPKLVGTAFKSGAFRFTFTNATGASFSVLATNNLTSPLTNWPVVGQAVESPAGSGNYQFTNSPGTNRQFYLLRQP